MYVNDISISLGGDSGSAVCNVDEVNVRQNAIVNLDTANLRMERNKRVKDKNQKAFSQAWTQLPQAAKSLNNGSKKQIPHNPIAFESEKGTSTKGFTRSEFRSVPDSSTKGSTNTGFEKRNENGSDPENVKMKMIQEQETMQQLEDANDDSENDDDILKAFDDVSKVLLGMKNKL